MNDDYTRPHSLSILCNAYLYIPQWCSIQHTKGTWIKITFYSHLLTAAERTITSLNSNFFLEIWTYTHRKNVRQRRKKLVFILFRHHVILLYILKFVSEENIFFVGTFFRPAVDTRQVLFTWCCARFPFYYLYTT